MFRCVVLLLFVIATFRTAYCPDDFLKEINIASSSIESSRKAKDLKRNEKKNTNVDPLFPNPLPINEIREINEEIGINKKTNLKKFVLVANNITFEENHPDLGDKSKKDEWIGQLGQNIKELKTEPYGKEISRTGLDSLLEEERQSKLNEAMSRRVVNDTKPYGLPWFNGDQLEGEKSKASENVLETKSPDISAMIEGANQVTKEPDRPQKDKALTRLSAGKNGLCDVNKAQLGFGVLFCPGTKGKHQGMKGEGSTPNGKINLSSPNGKINFPSVIDKVEKSKETQANVHNNKNAEVVHNSKESSKFKQNNDHEIKENVSDDLTEGIKNFGTEGKYEEPQTNNHGSDDITEGLKNFDKDGKEEKFEEPQSNAHDDTEGSPNIKESNKLKQNDNQKENESDDITEGIKNFEIESKEDKVEEPQANFQDQKNAEGVHNIKQSINNFDKDRYKLGEPQTNIQDPKGLHNIKESINKFDKDRYKVGKPQAEGLQDVKELIQLKQSNDHEIKLSGSDELSEGLKNFDKDRYKVQTQANFQDEKNAEGVSNIKESINNFDKDRYKVEKPQTNIHDDKNAEGAESSRESSKFKQNNDYEIKINGSVEINEAQEKYDKDRYKVGQPQTNANDDNLKKFDKDRYKVGETQTNANDDQNAEGVQSSTESSKQKQNNDKEIKQSGSDEIKEAQKKYDKDRYKVGETQTNTNDEQNGEGVQSSKESSKQKQNNDHEIKQNGSDEINEAQEKYDKDRYKVGQPQANTNDEKNAEGVQSSKESSKLKQNNDHEIKQSGSDNNNEGMKTFYKDSNDDKSNEKQLKELETAFDDLNHEGSGQNVKNNYNQNDDSDNSNENMVEKEKSSGDIKVLFNNNKVKVQSTHVRVHEKKFSKLKDEKYSKDEKGSEVNNIREGKEIKNKINNKSSKEKAVNEESFKDDNQENSKFMSSKEQNTQKENSDLTNDDNNNKDKSPNSNEKEDNSASPEDNKDKSRNSSEKEDNSASPEDSDKHDGKAMSDEELEKSSRVVLGQLKDLQSIATSPNPDPRKINVSSLHPGTVKILKKLGEVRQKRKEKLSIKVGET